MTSYFSQDELKCKCGCGVYKFSPATLTRLNLLREACGFPLVITSGYRCPAYNTKRGFTQTHSTGHAVDILCDHEKAHKVLTEAARLGFTGIGVNQKGDGRYIHLDDLPGGPGMPRPNVWSY